MKTHFLSLFLLFFSLHTTLNAQEETTQTIKGTIVDKQSQYPIPGVVVKVTSMSPLKHGVTSIDGKFNITGITLGRHNIHITALGYLDINLNNILVSAGKQVDLSLEMEEFISKSEEVEIIIKSDKKKAQNSNTSVSARTFSIDEISKYAASRNDPARAVQNYAGVGTGSDSRNDIIIRGNSPLGVQWRLEDMIIPNPNHFGALGTTGGPVSILNNNVLANSDFMTGAFPAEYGNVSAGVFDLKMRKGNEGKREYMGQVGFNGFELGVEGPFKKDKGSSYLANYRYSTIGLFSTLGINFGTVSVPQYQDLSFKMHFPTEKAGDFTVFGIGGISYIELLGSEAEDQDLFADNTEDVYFGSDMGAFGINHRIFINKNTYSQITLGFTGVQNKVKVEELIRNTSGEIVDRYDEYLNQFKQSKVTLNYKFNKKFNSQNNITAGIATNFYHFNMVDSVWDDPNYRTLTNFEGNSVLSNAYFHWQHKFSNKLMMNNGLHFLHFALNNSTAIEPRIGFVYQVAKDKAISFGTGLHSQQQPFQVYFQETAYLDGTTSLTNENLGFTKAVHLVGGFDWNINENIRFKSEAYYQHLYQAPVTRYSSSFSLLNAGADFGIPSVDSLNNNGKGRNYGVEFTFEHFYSKGLYYLITTSIFDSKYQGSDGKWRNTAFNGQYLLNALIGKEFKTGDKTTLSFDLKATLSGGKRYTPIDLEASKASGDPEFDTENAFSAQYPYYFRPDLRISFRKEGKKVTQEWAFDVQNFIGRQNVFSIEFNQVTQELITKYQLGFFPVGQYKILF